MSKPITNAVFLYHSKEKDYAINLVKYLKPLVNESSNLKIWIEDKEIKGGDNTQEAYEKAIKGASQIYCLLSSDFLGEDFYLGLMNYALTQNKHIVPILGRPCLHRHVQSIKGLQVLPKSGKSISKYNDLNDAIEVIGEEIIQLLNKPLAASKPAPIKEKTPIYYTSKEYEAFQTKITLLELQHEHAKTNAKKDEYYQKLKEEKEKLEAFKQGVISLANTFQNIIVNTERLKIAKQHFDNGEYKEARAILDTTKDKHVREQVLQQKQELETALANNATKLRNFADEDLIEAELTLIDYSLSDRFERTKTCFEKSLGFHRNEENLFAYAKFLHNHNQNNEAEPLYEEALTCCRGLIEKSDKHLVKLAKILNHLGRLQRAKEDFTNAKKSYKEAVNIWQDLNERHPDNQNYLFNMAATLNNLGNLYQANQNVAEAEICYTKALTLKRKLVEQNPQDYEKSLVSTLNDLGRLRLAQDKLEEAEKYYEEALVINKNSAISDSIEIRENIAKVKNNLARVKYEQSNWEDANTYYQEALEQYQKLSEEFSPRMYLPDVATTLDNVGTTNQRLEKLKEAKKNYQEALNIRRKLAEKNPETYSPFVADSLNNLAAIYDAQDNLEKAKEALGEALATLEGKQETERLARTLFNFGKYYEKLGDQTNEVLFLKKLRPILSKLVEQMPIYESHLEATIGRLEKLGTDTTNL